MRGLSVIATGALALVPLASAAPPRPGPEFTNVSNVAPAWSPDGKRLVYSSSVARHAQLYVIDAAGRRARRLTHDSGNEFAPQFLRDGTLIFRGQDAGKDFVGRLDARGRTVVLPVPGNAVFSPDGKRIVYDVPAALPPDDHAVTQVWIADAQGAGARMLVPDASHDGAQPAWSPDGTRIAYIGGNGTDRTIHVIGADGSGDREITHDGSDWSPVWSPDGTRIAYAIGAFGNHRYRLAVVNADGSNPHDLTPGTAFSDVTPAWSPDGRRLAFASDRSHSSEIWVMRAGGGGVRRITYGGCTVIGTTRADTLVGTNGRDVVCGFEGNDTLRGLGGDDRLVGGPGDDRLDGGAGADVLLAEQGNDVLRGGPGIDSLDGGSGIDTAFADARDVVRNVERRHGAVSGAVTRPRH